jgi:hypothetical protein
MVNLRLHRHLNLNFAGQSPGALYSTSQNLAQSDINMTQGPLDLGFRCSIMFFEKFRITLSAFRGF